MTVPSFPLTLWDILERAEYNEVYRKAICWCGPGISVNPTHLEPVLRNHFRHDKPQSFLRQLNMYGFHHDKTGIYVHPIFNRLHKDTSINIRRRPQAKTNRRHPKPKKGAKKRRMRTVTPPRKRTNFSEEIMNAPLHPEDLTLWQRTLSEQVTALLERMATDPNYSLLESTVTF